MGKVKEVVTGHDNQEELLKALKGKLLKALKGKLLKALKPGDLDRKMSNRPPIFNSEITVSKSKTKPIRRCIGCNQSKPQDNMLRIVCNNKGIFELDSSRTIAGRGAYICIDRHCWEAGIEKSRFERAFKINNVAPDSLSHLANFKTSVSHAV
jgi:predicted RNA-binding protein YlxR (DUF448 family)